MSSLPRVSRRAVLGVVFGLIGFGFSAGLLARSYRSAVGANSPGEAVERFLVALENGDALGVAQVLQPDEGRVFAPDAEPMMRQLRRFGSLAQSPNSPTVSSSTRRWQLASVSSSFASAGGAQAKVEVLFPDYPKGVQKADRITRTLDEGRTGRWVRHFLSTTGKKVDRSVVLVTIRSESRWYVSLTRTAGQAWDRLAARKVQSSKNINRQAPIVHPLKPEEAARGADSAEQAVQDWLDALADLDYQMLRARTNPLEAAAFPLEAINTVWGGRVGKLRRQFDLSVADSTGSMKRRSSRFGTQVVVPVTFRDAKFALTEPGAEPFVAQYHEGCLVILSGGKATKHCGRQISRFGEQFSIPVSAATIDRFVSRVDALAAARRSLPGFVVVRRDGKWFVSPTQTLLLNLGEGLSNAKRADIEALADDLANAISSEH